MKYIFTILAVAISALIFGQTGYTSVNTKQWNKDTVLNTKAMKINSQGGLVIGTYDLNGNALLELNSTTKGFLPSRMTTAQRNAISLPANGLMLYDTDLNLFVRYDSADGWKPIGGIGAAANGLRLRNDTVRLGGTLDTVTDILMGGNRLTIQQGTVPSIQHLFSLGGNSIDATQNGMYYVKFLNNVSSRLVVDSSIMFLGRANVVTNRSAILNIKNEANGSKGNPDITLEVKKSNTSSRFGFSADTASCEIYNYDPILGDITVIGTDVLNRQAEITSLNAVGTAAARVIVDTFGVKFIHGNNMNRGYTFPTDTGTIGDILQITSNAAGGNNVLNWTPNNIVQSGSNISMPTLGTYADDAAAAGGGVPIGGLYVETVTGYIKRRLV